MAEYFKKDGDNFVEVEEKLLPQTEVDKVVETRLERQKKSLTEQYADYDELKEKAGKVDSIASEYEDKLKAKDTELSEAQKLVGSAKLETVKVKAIHQFKLSDELSEFLNGEDEKTILSQAEKLSKGVGGSSVVIDKNKKPAGGEKSELKTVTQSIFGKKSDD